MSGIAKKAGGVLSNALVVLRFTSHSIVSWIVINFVIYSRNDFSTTTTRAIEFLTPAPTQARFRGGGLNFKALFYTSNGSFDERMCTSSLLDINIQIL